ncbi:MAG: adenylate kinase [Pirellulales bacterium]
MRIVFIGPPGVGKGTQSERLIALLNAAHLSTGDMLRQARREKTDLGQKADEYMSAGKLVPDDLMLELVGRRLDDADCRRGYLLDGFPRTLGQARALDEMLKKRETPLDVVLELTADTEELVKRLAGRGRHDDKPDIVRNRLEEYRRQTAPLSDYYRALGLLQTVDGEGTPDEVFGRIKTAVNKLADK